MELSRANAILPIAAMVSFTALAAAVLGVLPLLVGAMIEDFGLTVRQAGWVAAADMFGAMLSALGVSFVMVRGRWKRLLTAAIVTLAVANALSGTTTNFVALVGLRVLGGLGEGVILAIAFASIGRTRVPDRVYGLATAAQLGSGAAALYVLPSLLAARGLDAVFACLAAVTLLFILLVRYMPDSAGAAPPVCTGTVGLSKPSWIALAGVLAYFITQGGVWTYMDRIGTANRLTTASIGTALALCSIAGLLGAAAASWLDLRLGRIKPIAFACGCTVLSLLVLNTNVSFGTFAAMASLFNFAWNFSGPFQYGALARIDPTQRTVALGSAAAFAGLTVGPILAASLIHGSRFDNINWMGIGFCVLSLILFIRVLRLLEQPRLQPQI